MTNRRQAAARIAAATLGIAALPARAAWPDKGLTIVVPFPAGSAADANVRVLAERLRALLGVAVVVDNKPGANGILGTNAVARAAPDGYTVLYHSASVAINPWLLKDAPDPTKVLLPIAQVASTPYILAARADLGLRTLADFIAYAKANPGKLSCSTYGIGSPPHLALELLKQSAGIQVLHVPYRGFAQALVDLSSGQLDCAMDLPANVLAQGRPGGKIVVLGATAPSTLPSVADVPVISREHPSAAVFGWSGLFAPAGTPPDVAARLADAARRVMTDPAVQANLSAVGMSPSGGVTRDEFARTVDSDYRRFGAIILANGIKLQ